MNINELTREIIGSAIDVHRELGPGLLESVYEECLAMELSLRKRTYERQSALPVVYKGRQVAVDLRIDLIVDRLVIVELKSVGCLAPVHDAQLLTYLRLTGCKVGLLINFNVPVLSAGVKRLVNKFDDSASPRLGGES